jgi:hypothetical protein
MDTISHTYTYEILFNHAVFIISNRTNLKYADDLELLTIEENVPHGMIDKLF